MSTQNSDVYLHEVKDVSICQECFAVVPAPAFKHHDIWHENLKRLLEQNKPHPGLNFING